MADYIETEDDVIGHLEIALEDYDPSHFAHVLGAIARSEGMSKIAAATGMSRQALYKALSAEGNPGFTTVLTVLKALGFKLALERIPEAA
jgi:probable addiction module antidote protein